MEIRVGGTKLLTGPRLSFYKVRLSLFRVAPFSENTAFQGQGGPDIQNATT